MKTMMVVNVGSLEKRSNQLKYYEPKHNKSRDYCKADHDNICFFITIFWLAIPAFFRFTDVNKLMIGIIILNRWRMWQKIFFKRGTYIYIPILPIYETKSTQGCSENLRVKNTYFFYFKFYKLDRSFC